MSRSDVALRPWTDGDLWLLERLLGEPAMMRHLGGPEAPEAILAGWVGYWESDWEDGAVWE